MILGCYSYLTRTLVHVFLDWASKCTCGGRRLRQE